MNENSIRIAIIVTAPREMSLSAGREEIVPQPLEVTPEEDLPFLNVGRARGDELHLSGPLIGDPGNVAAGLELAWYFPDEEAPEAARPIDLTGIAVSVNTLPRRQAGPGRRWRFRLESSRPYRAVLFFEGSFMPPFKAADLRIHLDHLINYHYDGYILSRLSHSYRPPAYTETDWHIPVIESEGWLED